jgi:hemerythrin
MDETHREFVDTVNTLLTCPDEALVAGYEAFIKHVEAHFKEEDEWMRSTDFPPKDCHIDEHAAVMASVRAVFEQVKAGDHAEGRRLARALADWFPGHAFHLDSALSHWMCKRAFGGKPVVLRRNVATKG